MRRFSVSALLLACLAFPARAAENAPRPIAIDDFAKLRRVAEPQRSPEGEWVAYTVGTTDVEKDKRDTDLWMARWDGSREVRLTSSTDSESTPRWSPDGRYRSFLAARGEEDEKKKGAQAEGCENVVGYAFLPLYPNDKCGLPVGGGAARR